MTIRVYSKEYKGILNAVFGVRKAFTQALAPLQILDGVQHGAKAFSVKTTGTPVVVGEYKTDSNVAFGTGTGNSSRFGERKEIIYQDKDVEYTYNLAIHEGIDRFTVNNDIDAAIADRLKLHAEAQTRAMNTRIGKFIADAAGKTENLANYEEANVRKLFAAVDKYYLDNEVIAPVTAFVNAELYNAILDMSLTTTGKGSSISIDENRLLKFKGITLVETPTQYLGSDVNAVFVPQGVVIPFVGIETARTIESEDFDGYALQAAAKGGQYILDENKKAIVKVTGASID